MGCNAALCRALLFAIGLGAALSEYETSPWTPGGDTSPSGAWATTEQTSRQLATTEDSASPPPSPASPPPSAAPSSPRPPPPTTTTTSTSARPTPQRAHFHHHHHHQGARWGPYFEDGPEPQNMTARVGSPVTLDCRIGMLHDKTVTWLHRKPDAIRLLTVGRSGYSADQRIALSFRYPNNWRLQILYVSRRDQGVYECQVATHPPRVKQVFLKVTAPEVVILDENKHAVEERYYKAGSVVELTCLANQLEPGDGVTWTHGDATITSGISLNTSLGPGSVAATLKVNPARKSHSGNYSCRVGDISSATAVLHILNGEIPAAVHHGNLAVWHRPTPVQLFITLILHSAVLR